MLLESNLTLNPRLLPGGKHNSSFGVERDACFIRRKDAYHVFFLEIGGRTLVTEVPFRRSQTFLRCIPIKNNFVEAFTKWPVIRRWHARIEIPYKLLKNRSLLGRVSRSIDRPGLASTPLIGHVMSFEVGRGSSDELGKRSPSQNGPKNIGCQRYSLRTRSLRLLKPLGHLDLSHLHRWSWTVLGGRRTFSPRL